MKVRIAAAVLVALAAVPLLPRVWNKTKRTVRGVATIEDRLREYGEAARARWAPHFEKAGIEWPPERLVLVGFKREKELSIYGANPGGPLKRLRTFPVLAASGGDGPKLREGDRQVPEGFYKIESLNPNSRFHLSLRINYPNAFDRDQAEREGRTNLGGDIMIHGNRVSIGCLAMGDAAAEDLFVLAAETGIENIRLLLCPADFRHVPLQELKTNAPEWMHPVYEALRAELGRLSPGATTGSGSGG